MNENCVTSLCYCWLCQCVVLLCCLLQLKWSERRRKKKSEKEEEAEVASALANGSNSYQQQRRRQQTAIAAIQFNSCVLFKAPNTIQFFFFLSFFVSAISFRLFYIFKEKVQFKVMSPAKTRISNIEPSTISNPRLQFDTETYTESACARSQFIWNSVISRIFKASFF